MTLILLRLTPSVLFSLNITFHILLILLEYLTILLPLLIILSPPNTKIILSPPDTKSGNILTEIADHFPQFLIVKKVALANKTMSHYQHDYSKFDQEKFLADFNNLDFEYLNDNQSDINVKFNRFLASLDAIVKKDAPLKKLSNNELKLLNKPWINKRIRKMMQFRDELLKKLKKRQIQQQNSCINNLGIELQMNYEKVRKVIFTIISM